MFFAAFGWLADPAADGLALFTIVLFCVSPWIVFATWRKFQRVLATLKDGKRVDATVRETTLSSRGDDSPDLYALSWRDDDGYLGSSLPAPIEAFSDYGEGDRITVYRNDQRESWWERDIFGPVIR